MKLKSILINLFRRSTVIVIVTVYPQAECCATGAGGGTSLLDGGGQKRRCLVGGCMEDFSSRVYVLILEIFFTSTFFHGD